MLADFMVREQLGRFERGNKKAYNRRGLLVRFTEIDGYVPSILILPDGGVRTRTMKTFERRHQLGLFDFSKRRLGSRFYPAKALLTFGEEENRSFNFRKCAS
jgi:hypothetical protein